MNALRWDETWQRLLEWTNGQGPSERLAAQLLYHEGYKNIDPSHPLGGRDNGKDAICTKDNIFCIMAVYFPRGQQAFSVIDDKFTSDMQKAQINRAESFVFVTNQELRLSERSNLIAKWPDHIDILHLERITAILDSSSMKDVRRQFLGIDFNDRLQGGYGGNAEATNGGTSIGGKGGDAGNLGSGGKGGVAKAAGENSKAMGGAGGHGGIGNGNDGGNAMIVKNEKDVPPEILHKIMHSKGVTRVTARGEDGKEHLVMGGGQGIAIVVGGMNAVALGREGGSAARHDGRGGRGGRSPFEILNLPHLRLPDGRLPGDGVRGPNTPLYEGKIVTISKLIRIYNEMHPNYPAATLDNLDTVPFAWINEKLVEMKTNWRVRVHESDKDCEFYNIDC